MTDMKFSNEGLEYSGPMNPGSGLIQVRADRQGANWLYFDSPERVISVHRHEDILPALDEVELATRIGYTAVGFISYEAAPAFEPAMQVHRPGSLPLLWFALHKQGHPVSIPFSATGTFSMNGWSHSLDLDAYRNSIAAIKDYIARGETYQVNYSFRLHSHFNGDTLSFFNALTQSQQGGYGAYIDTGDDLVCSSSPELFFRLDGPRMTCRPMKGTAARGLTWSDDEERALKLRHSAKNRAENLMIVDMIRNDLGRIARPGTVKVPRLFDVERYDTVLQMTSSVSAESIASLKDIFRALFPCASITGAPKIRTMQIIRELETSPRGIYTGCIGYIGPERQAQFNVAIRTVHINKGTRVAEFGTGGGIVWDSDPDAEYAECEAKSRVLRVERPVFSLLETILWNPESGYYLLDRHLDRLMESGRYFGISVSPESIREKLYKTSEDFDRRPRRIRLLVDERGNISIEAAHARNLNQSGSIRAGLARSPVMRSNRFLYHKTTNRQTYDTAEREHPGCDDVILWNEDGEITESCTANVVILKDGKYTTPPVTSGLLPGTMRAQLIEQEIITEQIIMRDDLPGAEKIYLINSVRGWVEAELSE